MEPNVTITKHFKHWVILKWIVIRAAQRSEMTNSGEQYAFQENAHCAGGKRIERAIGADEERGSYISSQMRE